jgi:hypothetical protein
MKENDSYTMLENLIAEEHVIIEEDEEEEVELQENFEVENCIRPYVGMEF